MTRKGMPLQVTMMMGTCRAHPSVLIPCITSLFAGSVVIYLLYLSKQRQIYGQSRLFATDVGPDRYRPNAMSGQPIGKQSISEPY